MTIAPHEIEHAATGVREIIEVGRLLSTFSNRQDAKPHYGDAVTAYTNALSETVKYLAETDANPQMISRDREYALSSLWNEASMRIAPLDANLANRCFIKGQGWLDARVWSDARFKEYDVTIDDMREALIAFNKSEGAKAVVAQPSPPSPAEYAARNVPVWYPIAGFVFATATFLSLLFFLLGPALDASRIEIFDVWVAFCVAASAAFLGGDAVAKGNVTLPGLGANPIQISAAGGIGVFVVVLILMNAFFKPVAEKTIDLATGIKQSIAAALAVPDDIAAKYLYLKSSANSGVAVLVENGAELEGLGLRGGGTYYNFLLRSQSDVHGADLHASDGLFSTGFAGLDFGYILDCGEVPFGGVAGSAGGSQPPGLNPTLSKSWSYLWTYTPPSTELELRSAQYAAHAHAAGTTNLGDSAPIIEGHSYLLRSIRPHRSDILVGIYVERATAEGRYYFVWKTLHAFNF